MCPVVVFGVGAIESHGAVAEIGII
jgi:hypothetical protein